MSDGAFQDFRRRHGLVGVFVDIALCLVPSLAFAADLDAPASKPVTIRSEILRGSRDEGDCSLRQDIGYWAYADCITRALGQENDANTDTDAFVVGYYVGVVGTFDRFARDSKNAPYRQSLSEDRDRAYRTYVKARDRLGITDAQVCGATAEVSCPPKAAMP